MLSELHRLNDHDLTMLCNVAPVAPAAVLDAIEWTVNSEYGPSFLDGIQISSKYLDIHASIDCIRR